MKTIPLTRGYFTKVDDDDYKKWAIFRWCAFVDNRNPNKIKVRAYRREKGKSIYLSRKIMNPPEGLQVDHINRDTLDNRKSNLRICTPAENQWNKTKYDNNKTGYQGVRLDKRDGRFYAKTQRNNKTIYLGGYKTAEEANERLVSFKKEI